MSRAEKYGDLDFSDEREARRSERRKKSERYKAHKKPMFDADDYVDFDEDYDPYEDWHDLPSGRDYDSFDNR